MKQSREELEYAISQYLDGTLPPLERNTLEERLATDADARAILAEYRALDDSLQALPVPNVAWDRFAAHISKSLESEELPVRHFSIGAVGWTGRLAIAAMLLFGITVAVYFVRPAPSGDESIVVPNPTIQSVAVISGPTVEHAAGSELADVSIGPAPAMATGNWQTSEEIVSRPTVVLIDKARSAAQDTEQSPY